MSCRVLVMAASYMDNTLMILCSLVFTFLNFAIDESTTSTLFQLLMKINNIDVLFAIAIWR